MATKRKSKGAYMISAVAEMYDIHPQTLRLQGFVDYVRTEMLTRMQQQQQPGSGLVPVSRPAFVPHRTVVSGKPVALKSAVVAGKSQAKSAKAR